MVTFFIIFSILVLINAALLIFSALQAEPKVSRPKKGISETAPTKIYPLDLISSKYKKAI